MSLISDLSKVALMAVLIDLPDNIITTILFGSKKSISFTKDDFEELKSMVTAE